MDKVYTYFIDYKKEVVLDRQEGAFSASGLNPDVVLSVVTHDEEAESPPVKTLLDIATPAYARKRKAEYPPVGDQLDAIWKELGTHGVNNTEALAMLESIATVKAKYPKK